MFARFNCLYNPFSRNFWNRRRYQWVVLRSYLDCHNNVKPWTVEEILDRAAEEYILIVRSL
jgi:hypothetical protein